MTKQELNLLERAFAAEIGAAIEGTPRLVATKSKVAAALVSDGLLAKCVEVWRGVKFEGYELTHAGRFAYCATCDDEDA